MFLVWRVIWVGGREFCWLAGGSAGRKKIVIRVVGYQVAWVEWLGESRPRQVYSSVRSSSFPLSPFCIIKRGLCFGMKATESFASPRLGEQ